MNLIAKFENAPTKLQEYFDIMKAIDESPSQELQKFKSQITEQLLEQENPTQLFRDIEAVFVKNNLPTVGKIFRVFEIFYPPEKLDRTLHVRQLSPVLTQETRVRGQYVRRYDIIYRDLLRVHLFSGNSSLREYVGALQDGGELIERYERGEHLDERSMLRLRYCIGKLQTLQRTSLYGRQHDFAGQARIEDDDISFQLSLLRESLGVGQGQSLNERVVEMFLRPLGLHSLDEVEPLIQENTRATHNRRIQLYQNGTITDGVTHLTIKAGDLLKGSSPRYFGSILQNGITAPEFLGENASSDATPFGTDAGQVQEDDVVEGFSKAIEVSPAKSYGDLIFVIQDRGQFQHTQAGSATRYDMTKYETYSTSVADKTRHVDVRTGMPSAEIDFIIAQDRLLVDPKALDRVFFSIAQQGAYIPVTDGNGRVIFTPMQYQEYRNTFAGLKAFDGGDLKIIHTPTETPHGAEIQALVSLIKQDIDVVKTLSERVRQHVEHVLHEQGIVLQDEYDRGLIGARLIDIGSAGRHTNVPGDYDFDLSLLLDATKFPEAVVIKDKLLRVLLPREDKSHVEEQTGYVQVRAIGTEQILSGELLDVDIGIARKSDNLPFATQDAMKARLEWIRVHDGEDVYFEVLAHIVRAKQLLKRGKAYKKAEHGGFGGVGTETWILANHGNLDEACRSFWDASHDGQVVFPLGEFKKRYKLHDPGINLKYNQHDNYIELLTEQGYQAMLHVVAEYLGLILELGPASESITAPYFTPFMTETL